MAVCEKFYLLILFYNPFLFFSNALIFRKKNLPQIRERDLQTIFLPSAEIPKPDECPLSFVKFEVF